MTRPFFKIILTQICIYLNFYKFFPLITLLTNTFFIPPLLLIAVIAGTFIDQFSRVEQSVWVFGVRERTAKSKQYKEYEHKDKDEDKDKQNILSLTI